MTDYLMREAAPFEDEYWEKIDNMVVSVARKELVGRRLLDLVGPLGWGIEVAPLTGFEERSGATFANAAASYVSLKTLSADFGISARQLSMHDQTPFSMDLGAAAIAVSSLVRAEDNLVIGGLKDTAGIKSPIGDWDTIGGPSAAVNSAIAAMRENGFAAPFALVMSHAHFARLSSLMMHGRRELELVKTLVEAGIFASASLKADDPVLLLCPSSWNMDLVIGQDIATAYLGNDGLDHLFRIMETLVLRVKRPGAICLLES